MEDMRRQENWIEASKKKKKKEKVQDFPSSLVVGKLHFHFRVWGFNPWLGKRRSHMLWGVAKK